MLISRCLCGSARGEDDEIRGIPIRRCMCGIEFQRTELTRLELELYYRDGYHADCERHEGVIPYKDRYENDKRVAGLRIDAYAAHLADFGMWKKPLKILDVGAANGAFVDECRRLGHDAIGIEPDASFARDFVMCGYVLNVDGEGTFDLITYHDVLEHVVNPVDELYDARHMLKSDGMIVVDVPDIAVDAGLKHYKREHLWYFTARCFSLIAKRLDLRLRAQEFPIPGKMVSYLCART